MPTEAQQAQTETVQEEDVLLLAALLIVAPISSALIMWGLLPHAMGWIYPVISL